MKNYEKYADEIKEYNGDSICTDFIEPYILKSINAKCINTSCTKCINTSCTKCNLYRTIWLLEDYKEPPVDWSKVEVDTPILVRQTKDGEWLRRHFAKYEDGIVYAWKDAFTSWTVSFDEDVYAWKFAKLAESEDE